MERIKLAICVPSSGQCKTFFAQSLAGLVASVQAWKWWPQVEAFETTLFVQESSVIHDNRENLVRESLKWEATHLLFIDDDMVFSPEAVRTLFSRRHPIVICNYPKRGWPLTPTAVRIDKKAYVDPNGTGIEEAYYGGFGLALISMEVFKKVPRPWFQPRWDDNSDCYTTEDLPFFEKAREAGFQCWVDNDASKSLIHVGTHNFSWALPEQLKEKKDGE